MIQINTFDGEDVPFPLLDALPWDEGGEARVKARHRRWQRLLMGNPAATRQHRPLVWVALDKGRPLGCLLGVPFQARTGRLVVHGHWGVDLLVRPDSRGKGIGRRLLEHWRDATPLALGLGITDRAFHLETALGWKPVPLPPRLVKPLTLRGAILTWSRPRPRGADETRPESFPYPVTISREVPRGINRLYQQVADAWPWHVCRQEAELQRRYGEWKARAFYWVTLRERSRIVAAAVLKLHRNRMRTKVWIYELLVDAGGPVFPRLIDACLDVAASMRTDVVETRATDPETREGLLAAGFQDGDREDRFIVHARDPDLAAKAPWQQAWRLSLGDSGNL